jgi:hypothetical protein
MALVLLLQKHICLHLELVVFLVNIFKVLFLLHLHLLHLDLLLRCLLHVLLVYLLQILRVGLQHVIVFKFEFLVRKGWSVGYIMHLDSRKFWLWPQTIIIHHPAILGHQESGKPTQMQKFDVVFNLRLKGHPEN